MHTQTDRHEVWNIYLDYHSFMKRYFTLLSTLDYARIMEASYENYNLWGEIVTDFAELEKFA